MKPVNIDGTPFSDDLTAEIERAFTDGDEQPLKKINLTYGSKAGYWRQKDGRRISVRTIMELMGLTNNKYYDWLYRSHHKEY